MLVKVAPDRILGSWATLAQGLATIKGTPSNLILNSNLSKYRLPITHFLVVKYLLQAHIEKIFTGFVALLQIAELQIWLSWVYLYQ